MVPQGIQAASPSLSYLLLLVDWIIHPAMARSSKTKQNADTCRLNSVIPQGKVTSVVNLINAQPKTERLSAKKLATGTSFVRARAIKRRPTPRDSGRAPRKRPLSQISCNFAVFS
jgi:hypothetical protein